MITVLLPPIVPTWSGLGARDRQGWAAVVGAGASSWASRPPRPPQVGAYGAFTVLTALLLAGVAAANQGGRPAVPACRRRRDRGRRHPPPGCLPRCGRPRPGRDTGSAQHYLPADGAAPSLACCSSSCWRDCSLGTLWLMMRARRSAPAVVPGRRAAGCLPVVPAMLASLAHHTEAAHETKSRLAVPSCHAEDIR